MSPFPKGEYIPIREAKGGGVKFLTQEITQEKYFSYL